jgi:hypothetical protein
MMCFSPSLTRSGQCRGASHTVDEFLRRARRIRQPDIPQGEVRVFRNRLFVKPPGVGGAKLLGQVAAFQVQLARFARGRGDRDLVVRRLGACVIRVCRAEQEHERKGDRLSHAGDAAHECLLVTACGRLWHGGDPSYRDVSDHPVTGPDALAMGTKASESGRLFQNTCLCNSKCKVKMQTASPSKYFVFAFCILHFAFRLSTFSATC